MTLANKLTEKRYALSPGTQVREEDFGLLFYTMAGPRLYYLPSGNILRETFFNGKFDLSACLDIFGKTHTLSEKQILSLRQALEQLTEKGVIYEC